MAVLCFVNSSQCAQNPTRPNNNTTILPAQNSDDRDSPPSPELQHRLSSYLSQGQPWDPNRSFDLGCAAAKAYASAAPAQKTYMQAAAALQSPPVFQKTPAIITSPQNSFPTTRQDFQEAINNKKNTKALIKILESIPKEKLNEYNDGEKTIAHDLIQIFWDQSILDAALKAGVDFTKPSRPLRNCYTLAHSIAKGIPISCYNTKSKTYNQDRLKTRLNCLVKLSNIDDGKHFFLPSNEGSVWDLLRACNPVLSNEQPGEKQPNEQFEENPKNKQTVLEAFHELRATLHPDKSICLD